MKTNTLLPIGVFLGLLGVLSLRWASRHLRVDISERAAPEAKSQSPKSPDAERSKTTAGAHEILKKLIEGGQPPKPSAEELMAFVEQEHHSAASLLAAWQLGGDSSWLEEAAQHYPDDPRVALAELSSMQKLNEDAKTWIESLKKNDPGNATGWCYDSLARFQEGDTEGARTALAEAAQRGRMDGYTEESQVALTKAYLSAGYQGFEAEFLGTVQESIPLARLAMNVQKEAVQQLGSEIGDQSIQDMLSLAKLVRGGTETPILITQLVGSAIEGKMLDQLNTLDLIPGTRKFVLERIAELDSEKTTVKTLVQKAAPLLSSADESELKQYFRRSKMEGELKALQWLLARHPELK